MAAQPEAVREVRAKSITRVAGVTDTWFLARYGMNLYRGCGHDCLYCDGRAERYYVEGEFGRDVVAKVNAVDLLERELGRAREPGFVMLGGGVSDSYQPGEERYRLARGALEVAARRGLPVHVLTKSALVERDLDLLAAIARETSAILSFSLQTVDEPLRQAFEPGAAPVSERLRILEAAAGRGIATGLMAMPVLPGLSDSPEHLEALYRRAREAGVSFVIPGGLTLRPGRQKACYLEALRAHRPDVVDGTLWLYREERPSGAPDGRYLARQGRRFAEAAARHGLPPRPPRRLFHGLVPLYTEAAVLLEHEEEARRRRGEPGRGLAASGFALQRWARGRFAANRRRSYDHGSVEAELSAMVEADGLAAIPGLGRAAGLFVAEVVREGRAR